MLKLNAITLGSVLVLIPYAASAADSASDHIQTLPDVDVVHSIDDQIKAWKVRPSFVDKYKISGTVESIDTKVIDERINYITVEDAIKYMPSIEVRQRFQGDTNEPMGTRTASVSQSARTMIMADGILLSNYLGNNNSATGSPLWNTVAPQELERSDMIYGPFSAQYAGNSMGGVLVMTTKMPKKFEAGATAMGAFGNWNVYNMSGQTDMQNYSMYFGDKISDFSFRFDYNHLYSLGQPEAWNTTVVGSGTTPTGSASTKAANTVNGAVASSNSYGAPMYVLGYNNGQFATTQNNMKLKLAYDFTEHVRLTYTIGMWLNNATANAQTVLTNASTGAPYYGTSPIINGKQYSTSSTIFTPNLYEQRNWTHGITLKSDTGGVFDWELVGSVVNMGLYNNSYGATQSPYSNPNATGRTNNLSGSNWYTVDAKGIWRTQEDLLGKHEVSFGFHNDSYQLNNPVYNTTSWQYGTPTTLYSNSQGQTMTQGYWAQDAISFNDQWSFTLGGRVEHWDAYNGVNQSTVGTSIKTLNQQNQQALNFSPKAQLNWNPSSDWRVGASFGVAYRYPTVSELFQTTTTNNQVINGNPNLQPEHSISSELAGEYFMPNGKARLSFFTQSVNNAIYSVNTLLSTGQVSSTNQNVPLTTTYGLEFSSEFKDVLIDKLNMYATGTWTQAKIGNDPAADQANILAATSTALVSNPGTAMPVSGAWLPRIPVWRSSFTVSYSPIERMTTAVSGRYSAATFSQLNNSDTYHNTYVGNSSYVVLDLKMNYKIDENFTFNAGIDNVTNKVYWLYHNFPPRTYVAQLKYDF